ncbi:AraC family transcriptional regulator [Paenibacillus sp. PR3]|uniref:AraC family transcriptional regulator n=1 Tax=Paenibacillus terricola TaxID=2763503 RepID=A0ABR8MNF2_9BACL|nr:AraC family transcriptional regulator [Paenibacillus terricola]MBD3917546.1 AraC family transcriptional regulator [Paenibacillus terricola]
MSVHSVVVNERHHLLINIVMDYIEEHCSRKLSLQETSAIISYSPYHFHRLFKGVTGEKPNDYIKRIRLEKALMKIINVQELTLSEIAIDCGFSSLGDFSRAFKNYYGRNASEVRTLLLSNHDRKICEIDRKISESYFDTKYYNQISPDGSSRIEANRTLKVTIKQLPSYRVVYERCIGRQDPFSDQERILKAFENVSTWTKSNSNAIYQSMYIGIPNYHPILGDMLKWSYDACRTVPMNLDVEAGINSRQLAGGTYAVIQVEKQSNMLDAIMTIVWSKWLPDNGCVLDDSRPFLELYPVSDIGHAVYMDCCIPIIPRR